MKTHNLILVALLSITFVLQSCQKDEDPELTESDVIIGTWNVVRADATAYVDGFRVDGIEVHTTGTLKFDDNGTGYADFSLTFLDDTDTAEGPFVWRRDGFELVIHQEEEELRYAVLKDETNLQHLQVTYEEELSNDEVEFTFVLERR